MSASRMSFETIGLPDMSYDVFFFFPSRRRHTRCLSDWSSDVCSSDLHNKDDRGGAFTQVSMTIDAFAEYNVMTHDYGAEYGGASGAIVNAVTKSGTNQFRGSAYYYGQDDRFNATNYFTKLDGRPKPESGNDIVGASIGGPQVLQKTVFFFHNERQRRQNTAQPLV